MRAPLLGTRDLGRSRSFEGRAIGHVEADSSGLSWMIDAQSWEPNSERPHGALSMDPVTFQRLVNFLKTHSHTGMGHARRGLAALAQDTGGVNALARETAFSQAADEVIGPRHRLFGDLMEGL